MPDKKLLSIENLSVAYIQHGLDVAALRDVSIELNTGETLALVGESGCGKSTLALSVMGLLPERASKIPRGKIIFKNRDLLTQTKEEWRALRGKEIGMVFQDPFSSLNPVLKIGYQLSETLELDSKGSNLNKLRGLLKRVHLPEPDRILNSYPHQVSGGQRQRVMIAMAIAREPDLLIADEPTTALDVTVQDEIIKLINELQKDTGMAVIFVTHNLGLVRDVAKHVAVMRSGEIVEHGTTAQVLTRPKNQYTKDLLACTLTLEKTV